MARLLLALMVVCLVVNLDSANAQNPPVVLDRDGSTVALEPYSANIIRVTLSMNKDQAVAAPGYGFTATPATQGWSQQHSEEGDVYRSARLIVTVAPKHPWKPTVTQIDISKFFSDSNPGVSISFRTPEGKTLLRMTNWRLLRPMTSIITAWVRIRKVILTIVGTASNAGTITLLQRLRACVCRSW
jgi:alpha-D-xyloside xylohydrolase